MRTTWFFPLGPGSATQGTTQAVNILIRGKYCGFLQERLWGWPKGPPVSQYTRGQSTDVPTPPWRPLSPAPCSVPDIGGLAGQAFVTEQWGTLWRLEPFPPGTPPSSHWLATHTPGERPSSQLAPWKLTPRSPPGDACRTGGHAASRGVPGRNPHPPPPHHPVVYCSFKIH